MKTSRQRLLDYIRARRVVTAAELSQALQMTEANARHHLSILQSQKLVQVAGQRPPPGKGRPILLYSLSEQALGDNLDGLSEALLAEMLDGLGAEEQQKKLRQVAERLWNPRNPISARNLFLRNQISKTPVSNLTQRLNEAIQWLNACHYQARWEAHAEAPRLILGHCPYAAILPRRPELCQLDAFLLTRLCSAPVEQITRLAQDTRGSAYCMFRLKGV